MDKIVAECLPLYRAITRVSIGDGSSTAFWKDKWLPGPCLADRFPALFSHCLRPNISVAAAVSTGLHLQPRLTTAASTQLGWVTHHLDPSTLRGGYDTRVIDSSTSTPFSSRAAYRMLSPSFPEDASACTAWRSRLPSKLKIFTYLADIDRLSTRANLFFKNCAPSACCSACSADETGRHIFFDCTLAASVWDAIGVSIPAASFSIWSLPSPPAVATHVWHVGIAALLWALWKARNDRVFNGIACTRHTIIHRACADIAIWRWRLCIDDRPLLDSLRTFLLTSNL
jgi:hypothetical protein